MGWHRNTEDRLWERVNKDGPEVRLGLGPCWLWTGPPGTGGYGSMNIGRKAVRVHRLSWKLAHGDMPALDVLHRCDVPACVRPDHLFLGDDLANARDRRAKNRDGNHKGSANGRAKLNEEGARQIRARYEAGASPTDLAREFGVSIAAVWFVISRRTWKHA